MSPMDCLVFLATIGVLFAEGLYATAIAIPEPFQGALVVRPKRDDGRAMTFSGFFPQGGMTAYASSGDWGQWYRGHGYRRPIISEQGWNNQPTPTQTDEESSPELNESKWKEDANKTPDFHKEEKRPAINKKPKKPTHHKDSSSEEEEEDLPVSHGNSGGNAAASFNAWFPIMLGMFPPSEEGANGYSSSSRKSPPQTTIVANSVSHGPGGVASSHAVAYGGIPEQHYRTHH